MRLNKGKLIIIEGSDGSGKATQAGKLYDRLVEEGYKIMKVEFPDYKSESSALVKMYLRGDFGSSAGDVNAYAASTFYAVDRFASYKKDWEKFYLDGGIIISDRYTTSNMVHQAAKIKDEDEKNKYLDWLWNLEFELMGLPVPDEVVFLDMPPEYSRKLMHQRNNKITGEASKDIHESDYEFLNNSYKNSCALAEKYGWKKISCVDGCEIKSIEDIHEEIYDIIKKII